jgi:hypothetical protein
VGPLTTSCLNTGNYSVNFPNPSPINVLSTLVNLITKATASVKTVNHSGGTVALTQRSPKKLTNSSNQCLPVPPVLIMTLTSFFLTLFYTWRFGVSNTTTLPPKKDYKRLPVLYMNFNTASTLSPVTAYPQPSTPRIKHFFVRLSVTTCASNETLQSSKRASNTATITTCAFFLVKETLSQHQIT